MVSRVKIKDVVAQVSQHLGELWTFDKTIASDDDLQSIGTRAARIRESPSSVSRLLMRRLSC
jgi:hypothetical protein